MKVLFLLGSSRGDGHAARLAREVYGQLVFAHRADAEFIDISALNIGPYDYENANRGDDFLPVAQKMFRADAIVFASPVYWYAMSGQMKIFFDRLTDLTDWFKPVGKRLAGRRMFAVSTGGDPEAPASFVHPFEDTASYFNMEWGGHLHAKGADALTPETKAAAKAFAETIAFREQCSAA